MDLWAYANKVVIEFSRPGRPTDSAFIESVNGSLRDECLTVNWFADLTEADKSLRAWRKDYGESRPHGALNNQPPANLLANGKLKVRNFCPRWRKKRGPHFDLGSLSAEARSRWDVCIDS